MTTGPTGGELGKRIDDAFDAVLDLPPAEWGAFLSSLLSTEP